MKLGFIGAGNMAGAIIGGVTGSGLLSCKEIGVFDISKEKLESYKSRGFPVFENIGELVKNCGAVVIAVKPQNFAEVLPEIKAGITPDKLIISIAAGITAKTIKDGAGCDCKVILAMPNTPLLLGAGATACSAVPPATQEDLAFAESLFSSAGTAVEIPPDKMNEIIPVNGSSPAFFFYFAKLLAENAGKSGIPKEAAMGLVYKTMAGSAKMLMESGKTPDELIDMVCSPGGTTLAGMKALKDNGFETAVQAAFDACVKRAYELAALQDIKQESPEELETPVLPELPDTAELSGVPWYHSAMFYQIFPFGFCGAPEKNDGLLKNRIQKVTDWIPHIKSIGAGAVYFCPVFESGSHGYDTHDYTKIDSRLGTNKDFADVAKNLRESGIRVVLDGVFNHVGRGFRAFQDVLQNKWDSEYKDWFHIHFTGNSPFHDGFWYEGWEGHYELVKLNLKNPRVKEYLFSCIRGWVEEFGIDGLRLDVAYMLDEDFMRELRVFAKSLKPDFFLLGEAIHGDYNRIVNGEMLDSCTNYECYKGIYSSFNDRNMFEIAHSLNRQFGPEGWTLYKGKHLFNFADNHDVSRIASQLKNEKHLSPLYGLMFGISGIPCVYYGSEWGEKAVKTRGCDAPLRPCFEKPQQNALTGMIARYSRIRRDNEALILGGYRQIYLTNLQFVFLREHGDFRVLVAINADDTPHNAHLPDISGKITDLMTGEEKEIAGPLVLPPESTVFYRIA